MNKEITAHPYLVQLRKQAKELKTQRGFSRLSEAQFDLSKSLGFISWPKLVLSIQQKDLQDCIRGGDKDRVQTILSETPRLAQFSFEDGSTPVLMAAEFDDPDMIEMLYSAGGSLRERYANSAHTPLSWAITSSSFHAAAKLLELGEKPDLFCAAGLGSLPLVQSFWPNGKLIPNPSHTGSSRFDAENKPLPRPPASDEDQVSDALYMACRCGRLDVARWLLDQGADPNWRGYFGASNLAWAEFANVPELADLLRSRGGDDTVVDPNFLAPPRVFGFFVLIGWKFPSWRIRQRLAEDSSLANSRGGYGTALHVAIFNDNREAVGILLAAGADRSAKNARNLTPEEMAIGLGKPELAELVANYSG